MNSLMIFGCEMLRVVRRPEARMSPQVGGLRCVCGPAGRAALAFEVTEVVTRPTMDLASVGRAPRPCRRGSQHGVGGGRGGTPPRLPAAVPHRLRYPVTAWASDLRDEHALLGAVLETRLIRDRSVAEHFPGACAPVPPLLSLSVAADGTEHSDFHSALGGPLKPGLDLLVTATADVATLRAGPPVERYEIDVADRREDQ